MGINSIDAEDDQFAYRYDTQLLIDRRYDSSGKRITWLNIIVNK